ncbi:ABC transporter ATP-binding protein [Pseudoflavonifractor sp. 524-17]|uniref:ABC transporter ATP-binding protein n=1 Tax=Pseudoflavonifractor sp. 524-17 TaxID=2304577 RepID=UPI001379EC8B|nr:ABC transporter ATP-binding protein [Pseudoflavonifractor sp. 524-17]NCE63611.1 ABC transporter ATP-binding protein [Pseudoflavonifractor sp. 524-17]
MLKKLASYLGEYRKYAILTPLLVILEVICELALPRFMANIVNVGIAGDDLPYILKMGGIMLVLALCSMLCGMFAAKFAAIGGQGFGANLRRGIYNKVQEFSFSDIDRFSSASLITRITNDVNAIQMMVTMGLRMLTRSPVMLIAALFVAMSINARLALVLLVVIPLMALAVGLLMKICNRLFDQMQRKIDALNNTVQENLVAIRVVKAFVRAGYEKTKFKKSNDELTQATLTVDLRIILMMPIMTIALNAATAAVLYLGGTQVMGGSMLIGDLSSFITYIFQILMSVMMVAMSLLQLSRSIACARRIDEVLETRPSIQERPRTEPISLPAPRGQVEFDHVHFKYQAAGTGDDVLEDIHFTVAPGEFVAIVGGTGTGKSSLVNLIPRFYDVTGGAVRVDGVDVRDYPLDVLRARIGMVLQNNVLFSGTVRENLLWGRPDATEEEMIQAAKNAQAYDFIMGLPEGFDTWLDQGGVNVSGGQKQRLCIARAMLRHPAILILDDSTSAVDSATESAIRQSFSDNLAGTTVIIIAQRISSVQYADRILVLDDGRVADTGTHDELMARSAIYQEIYQSQQEGVQQ